MQVWGLHVLTVTAAGDGSSGFGCRASFRGAVLRGLGDQWPMELFRRPSARTYITGFFLVNLVRTFGLDVFCEVRTRDKGSLFSQVHSRTPILSDRQTPGSQQKLGRVLCSTGSPYSPESQLVPGIISCCCRVCTDRETAKNDLLGIPTGIRGKNAGLEAQI